MTLTSAVGLVWSVNRISRPTASPTRTSSSAASRLATACAAMRRGCVWPIKPSMPRPASRQSFGSCVVLPLPVSPQTMMTRCAWIAASNSSRAAAIGSESGYSSR